MNVEFVFLLVVCACVVHAQPEVFSRFSFSNHKTIGMGPRASIQLTPSPPGVAVLATVGDGLNLSGDTATTTKDNPDSTLTLDWGTYEANFTFGFYVSFWFRVRPANSSLNIEPLLKSDSFSVDFFTNSGRMSFIVPFSLADSSTSNPYNAIDLAPGPNWCRVTVGFANRTVYARFYMLESDGMASDRNQQIFWPTIDGLPRKSTQLVLGGRFSSVELDFRDVVLFRPRSLTDLMTVEHDNQIANMTRTAIESITATATSTTSRTGTTISTTNSATGATTTTVVAATSSPHTRPIPVPLLAGVIVGAFVLLAVLALSIWLWRHRRGTLTGGTPTPTQTEGTGLVRPVGVMPAPNDTNLARSNQYGVSPLPRNQYDDVADVQQHTNLYNDVSDVHNQHANLYDSASSSRLQ
jgi:hypothetical protein